MDRPTATSLIDLRTGPASCPRRRRFAAALALLPFAIAFIPPSLRAEDSWKPFAEKDAAAARRASQQAAPAKSPVLPPMSGNGSELPASGTPSPAFRADAPSPFSAKEMAVERGELAPVTTSDGSGMPLELWNGLDIAGVEGLLARLEIPPRSPAVNGLWRRLLQADALPPGGAAARFQALRAEAYRRSGLLQEQADVLAKATAAADPATADPTLLALKARSDITLGRTDAACPAVKEAAARKADLPKRIRGEIIVLAGYCAAAAGNAAAAGLAAELAREEGLDAPTAIAALDAIAAGPEAASKQKLTPPKKIDALDYRLLLSTAPQEPGTLIERADPSVLWLMIAGDGTEPKLKLAAAEIAARANVISPDRLGEIYRAFPFAAAELADPLGARPDPLTRRALLFKTADAERTPQKKTRLLRALLDDARRAGIYLPVLRAAAKPVASLQRQVEIGWFTETAVEALLAAERYEEARAWVAFGQQSGSPAMGNRGLQHWLGLIDIADPASLGVRRGDSLASVEQIALAGRFQPEMLHRLATVLDALDYQVPIPLWDAASKTPQPAGGHLPETGVLSELQEAAKKKEFGRTVLLTLRTLGPAGAEGAHMIALGDVIRALKRAGLEPDARRLGFEALFAGWPRAGA